MLTPVSVLHRQPLSASHAQHSRDSSGQPTITRPVSLSLSSAQTAPTPRQFMAELMSPKTALKLNRERRQREQSADMEDIEDMRDEHEGGEEQKEEKEKKEEKKESKKEKSADSLSPDVPAPTKRESFSSLSLSVSTSPPLNGHTAVAASDVARPSTAPIPEKDRASLSSSASATGKLSQAGRMQVRQGRCVQRKRKRGRETKSDTLGRGRSTGWHHR